MAREPRAGDRVRTPHGIHRITDVFSGDRIVTVDDAGRGFLVLRGDITPHDDIPRERVEALHAAVTARLEQLEASRAATWYASEKDIFAACHSDLSEVAEALRLLLEVDP